MTLGGHVLGRADRIGSHNAVRAKIVRGTHHDEQCSCRVLAAAIGASPESISYEYCRNVLQKRWGITCRHGEQRPDEAAPPATDRWQEVGKVDAVKAVLISEGPGSSRAS